MKRILLICMFFTLTACKDDTSETLTDEQAYCVSRDVIDQLSRTRGTVDKVANIYVIKTSQRTYYACNLPESLKKPGQSIRFDADVYRIPENVRLVGAPILLTKIY